MTIAILAALLMQASSPPPPASLPTDARPSVITMPDWQARPDAEQFAAFYPKAAVANGVEGFATLQCSVSAEGSLMACTVLTQSPPDAGFGDAVLAMAPLFRMRPMARDGQPVAGGTIRIPIRFALPHPSEEPTGLSAPVTGPNWVRKPTADDAAGAYPRRAKESGATGAVVLRCVIDARGRFDTCDVAEESPAGLGFGAAALELSKIFQMAPLDADGAKVAGRAIRIPIRLAPPAR